MTVFCLGSINADHVYQVDHLPKPGETISAHQLETFLGGKGANQSVAAARAGARVHHIGAVGTDGAWAVQALQSYGVKTDWIETVSAPTGHAIINVDASGENAIVIHPGTNLGQRPGSIRKALKKAKAGDILLLQNETDQQVETAQLATEIGLRVIYSAAPFDIEATKAILPYTEIIAVNAGEAAALASALGTELNAIGTKGLLVTLGSDGAVYYDNQAGETVRQSAFKVTPIDTTGAGDCFAGYFAAGLDQGLDIPEILRLAAAAAAIKVTRKGAAPGIPEAGEVIDFLKTQEL